MEDPHLPRQSASLLSLLESSLNASCKAPVIFFSYAVLVFADICDMTGCFLSTFIVSTFSHKSYFYRSLIAADFGSSLLCFVSSLKMHMKRLQLHTLPP